jgi:hypothetical protein
MDGYVFLGAAVCVRLNCAQPLRPADPSGNPGARTTISYQQTFLRISTEIIIASLFPPARIHIGASFIYSFFPRAGVARSNNIDQRTRSEGR